MSPATIVKSRGTVTIDVEACKGCELCIPACPPKVLTMSTPVNHKGYRYPELHPGCTGCAACFEQCPCHAIEMVPEPGMDAAAARSATERVPARFTVRA